MDNFHIDITSEGDMRGAMQIAFRGCLGKQAKGYKVDPKHGLIFFWSEHAEDGVVPLPFMLDADGAADFATRWLREQPYGSEPDHDGENGHGWRLYNESWGKVGNYDYSFVAVKPAWAMYGK